MRGHRGRRPHRHRQASVSNAPLCVGLLNGLMPLGRSGDAARALHWRPDEGAFAMFVFSLGTVPLMFSLGV